MERYKIYCTAEQAKKALYLGAPISTTVTDLFNNTWMKVTAEQMIGFLHDYAPEKSISVVYDERKQKWIYFIGDDEATPNYETRKEATLAAIDDVLNYFTEEE